MRKILVLLLSLMALGFAIQEVQSLQAGTPGKYNVTSWANYTTEGGNVTEINLTTNTSTEKWAGFWGQIIGNILLAPNTSANFYVWTWSPASSGEVCAVAASSGFDWSGVTTISAATIDTIWGFGSATDNATNTFTTSTCDLNINSINVTNTATADTGGAAFETCAVGDGGNAAKSDVAFCVKIANDGGLFNNRSGDYELLVATDENVGATETYYFWMELD